MRKQKILSMTIATVLCSALVACSSGGNSPASVTATPTPGAPKVTATPTPAPEPDTIIITEAPKEKVNVSTQEASVDFEDGNYAFAQLYLSNPKADASTMELVDYNGSKALSVLKAQPKTMSFVTIDAANLLGDKAADVASFQFDVASLHNKGFLAISGDVCFWSEGACITDYDTTDWNVYLDTNNPKTITVKMDGYEEGRAYQFGETTPAFVIRVKDDAAYNNGNALDDLGAAIIDNIRFLDASGNVIPADSAAQFAVAGFEAAEADRSNLVELANVVEFEGFATGAGAWAQDGFEMPQNFLDALVPGTVVECDYSSEDGEIWMVMPWATAGWIRVAQNDCWRNESRTTAQITYEQIEALCGEDKSTWGAMMQFEGSTNWEVTGVRVGTPSAAVEFNTTVEFPDFVTNAGAWAQAGFDMPQEVIDALVPGTVVKATYESESGELWLVMPNATVGWSRVGDGSYTGSDRELASCDGTTCYVTYEMIAAICGDDKAEWGPQMQFEASTPWEVMKVEIGTLDEVVGGKYVAAAEIPDFVTENNAWAQSGFDMTEDFIAALVPGSVIEASYSSEDGNIWAVFPGAAAGWSRVGRNDGDASSTDPAVTKDGKVYITYDQMVAIMGEDVSTWGATLQFEGSSKWEVTGVTVGKFVDAPKLRGEVSIPDFATTGGAWSQTGFDMPDSFISKLVPGCVIKAAYSSEDGNIWAVFPGAAAGWSRVGRNDGDASSTDPALVADGYVYITYDQMAAVMGDDSSTWGTTLQFEGSSNWEITGVQVGMAD